MIESGTGAAPSDGDSPGGNRERAIHRSTRSSRRKARASARSARQRWGRRALIAFCALVILVPAIGGAGWWYLNYRLGQVHHVKIAKGLLHPAKPGGPFNMLLIGSDSRAGESTKFGSSSIVTGQRSDVVIIARVVPKSRQVYLLSIPRDTIVDIPGNIANISGENKINSAFNNGPGLLIETIKKNFGISVEHFAEINFSGFQDMVNAVGGIYVDFPDRLKDAYSDLSIDHTGCQLIVGSTALAYVRSRHLYYKHDGSWYYDGLSDWSRIRRQDVFFHALATQVKSKVLNLLDMNNLLTAVVHNLTLDSTFSNNDLINLAVDFRHASVSSIHSEVLPTIPAVIDGADDLLPAKSYDTAMIKKFLALGTTAAKPAKKKSTTPSSTTPTTTTPSGNPSDVVFDTQPEPWNGMPCS